MAQKINNLFLLIINLPCQPPMSSMASTIKPVLPSQQFIVSTNSRWKFSRKSILPCLGMKNSPLNCSRQVWAAVSFDPSRDLDLSLFDEEESSNNVAPPPMPRKEGRYEVVINNEMISKLDLSAFHNATGITSPPYSGDPKELLERTVGFTFNYVREDPRDPREVSEFPDIRLWFVRLDSLYPWLPVVLDWRAGELARYAALLVPHQMNMKMGVVFNPEALELFVMKKVFVAYSWLKQHNLAKPRLKAKDMARMLGFGIGDELFDLIDSNSYHPFT